MSRTIDITITVEIPDEVDSDEAAESVYRLVDAQADVFLVGRVTAWRVQ